MDALEVRIEALEATLGQYRSTPLTEFRSLTERVSVLRRQLAPLLALDAHFLLQSRSGSTLSGELGRDDNGVQACSFKAAWPRVRHVTQLLERVKSLHDQGVVEAHPLLTRRNMDESSEFRSRLKRIEDSVERLSQLVDARHERIVKLVKRNHELMTILVRATAEWDEKVRQCESSKSLVVVS